MQKRAYGTEGIELSIVGFGGIVVSGTDAAQASSLVSQAIERGINYFDVAPSYGDAEERLGPALEPFRSEVFLACKTTERSRQGAADELRASLRQMRTDRFDLYQLHAMTTREDLETATGKDGALEAIVAAKEEGLVRHIGFSAHSAEVALELLDRFPFDSVLFPVNWNQYLNAGFGPQVVEKAAEKGASCLALKGMAFGKLAADQKRPYPKCWYEPIDDPELAELALRFTLSQPITAALPPGDARLYKMALDIAENFTPIDEGGMDELKRRAVGARPFFELGSAA